MVSLQITWTTQIKTFLFMFVHVICGEIIFFFLFAYLFEQEDALFIGRYDVEQFVTVDVSNGELRADAGVVVDLMRYEVDQTIATFLRLKPVQFGR